MRVVVILLSVLLFSCNVTKRSRSVLFQNVDSAAVHKSIADISVSADSTATLVKQVGNAFSKQVEVKFYDSLDSSTVIIHTEGNTTYIYPGTRRPSSVTVKESVSINRKDSSATRTNKSEVSTMSDYDSSRVIKDTNSKEVHVEKSKVPLVLIIIGVIALLGAAMFIKKKAV